jgi:hypothetical protein
VAAGSHPGEYKARRDSGVTDLTRVAVIVAKLIAAGMLLGALGRHGYDYYRRNRECREVLGVRSMSRELTQEEALFGIQKALATVEDAIRHQPERTRSLYDGGKAAFFVGAEAAVGSHYLGAAILTDSQLATIHQCRVNAFESDWFDETGLTASQRLVVDQYLVAASFMSAWFHMQWDKSRRDQAAQSACLLVSALGLDPLEVMQRFIMYEQAWRVCMRSAGVGLGQKLGCLVLVLSVIGIMLWLLIR